MAEIENKLVQYKERWNDFALEDAYTAICNPGGGKKCTLEAFNSCGQRDAKFILSFIGENKTILDFGCGIGRIIKFIAPYSKSVWGVDISSIMIAKAKEFLKDIPGINLKLIEQRTLPFATNMFDGVYSWLCFQHMDRFDAYCYFREIFRVLKIDGIFLATFPSLFSDIYFKGWEVQNPEEPTKVRIFTDQEIEFKLKRIGFKEISFPSKYENYIVCAKKLRDE